MNIREIVAEWLKANGYDGLAGGNDCGCDLDDLMPCNEIWEDCVAGHKVPCDCEGDCEMNYWPRIGHVVPGRKEG